MALPTLAQPQYEHTQESDLGRCSPEKQEEPRLSPLQASLKHPHPSPCAPQPLPSPQDTREQEGRQSTGPASPYSSSAREAFPTAATRHSTCPFPPRRCTGVTAHARPGEMGPQPSPPQEVYCCHHQAAHGLFQTSSQRAEARVPFLPVRSLSTQQPLPPQALISQHQHCSFSFTARGITQCHLCCRQDSSRHFLCRATRQFHGRLCQQ